MISNNIFNFTSLLHTASTKELYIALITYTEVLSLLLPLPALSLIPALPHALVDLGAGVAGWVPGKPLHAPAQVPPTQIPAHRVLTTDAWHQLTLILVQTLELALSVSNLAPALPHLAGGVSQAVHV